MESWKLRYNDICISYGRTVDQWDLFELVKMAQRSRFSKNVNAWCSSSDALKDEEESCTNPWKPSKEGRKEIYSSLAANKAEWMEKCLCISGPIPCQGRL